MGAFTVDVVLVTTIQIVTVLRLVHRHADSNRSNSLEICSGHGRTHSLVVLQT